MAAPAVSGATPLSYIQALPPSLEATLALHPQSHWWRQVRTVAPYAHISGVGVDSTLIVRFARAVGATCRVLLPQASLGWALVVLPSGQLRFIPNLGYVTLGGAQPQTARFFVVPNAGWGRRLGRRPLVRGTVRNPNDHPHGGRTRAIKYPRTP